MNRTPPSPQERAAYVEWFRDASPYLRAFRDRTVVVLADGESLAEPGTGLAADLALLAGLGVRLVVVPEAAARLAGLGLPEGDGHPVVDAQALRGVCEAVGGLALAVQAALSLGGAAGAAPPPRVVCGNFVRARPVGVRSGIDHGHAGEVRQVDTAALRRQLDGGAVVLVPPVGASLSGEPFLLDATQLAGTVAAGLGADKLMLLGEGVAATPDGDRVDVLTPAEAAELARATTTPPALARRLAAAARACRGGVRRAHLLDAGLDGAVLLELFTRDGVGTMVTDETYEELRPARLEDVPGLLALIAPLEAEGVLVRRSRERLETEIDRFTVLERDGAVIGCAALYAWPTERAGELACLAVHPDYRSGGRGAALLHRIERQARRQGLDRLFVLTTRASHWFIERGFRPARLAELPVARQALYNWQRNSRVYVKTL
ncbi:amino-acid N-acetyltransferase [Inmirania thermothiophila]|uniref:Amino-acid acetyltransferase n=1 Tax=Inmirania thermothiophila TaxID=1750597 RepID=A0A3N1Y942_9GAMM|nr:amino-acid N-acetyltransferase [Inmirania thermothiophila]ROR35018.1 N-acetylglutamate synthase [Inmirania thermothiophila]